MELTKSDIRILTEAAIQMKTRDKEQLAVLARNRNTGTERELFLGEIHRLDVVIGKLDEISRAEKWG